MFRVATNQFGHNSHRQPSTPIQLISPQHLGTDLTFKISTSTAARSRHATEEELELHIQRPHAQCLFLGEVLGVPTASEESVNGAAAFHLGEARADAPAGGAEAFLLICRLGHMRRGRPWAQKPQRRPSSSAKSSRVPRTQASTSSPRQQCSRSRRQASVGASSQPP
jgi:hypothetical protein